MNVIQPSCYNCKNQKLYHEYYGGKSFSDTRYTCKVKLKGIIWHPLHDHHPIKRKIKTKPEERYMRIVDLG